MERLHDAPFSSITPSSPSRRVNEGSASNALSVSVSTHNNERAHNDYANIDCANNDYAMLVSPVDDDAILRATSTLMQEQQQQTEKHASSSVASNSFANPSFRFFPHTLGVDNGDHRSHHQHHYRKDLPLLTPDESGAWADFRFLGLDPNENNDDDGSAQLLVSPPSSPTPTTTATSTKAAPTATPSTNLSSTTTTSSIRESSRFKKMPSPGSGSNVGGANSSSSSSSKKRRTYNKLDISSTMGVPLLADQMDDENEGEEEEYEEGMFGGGSGSVESEDTESVGMRTKENSMADLNLVISSSGVETKTTNESGKTAASPTRLIDNLKSTLSPKSKTAKTATESTTTETTTNNKSSFLGYYANLESKTSNINNDDDDKTNVVDDNDGVVNEDDDDNGSTKKKHFSSLNNLLDEDGMGQEEVEGMVVEDEDLDEEEEDNRPEEERNGGVFKTVEVLPAGWERHESDDGPYYWHIKSGTIQLEAPEGTIRRPASPTSAVSAAVTVDEKNLLNKGKGAGPFQSAADQDAATAGQEHLREFEDHALKFASESLKNLELQNASAVGDDSLTNSGLFTANGGVVDGKDVDKIPLAGPQRFAVKSLGWLQVEESDLTPERSSKAVNRCIVELSNPGGGAGGGVGRHSSTGRSGVGGGASRSLAADSIGGWGEGKDLSMEITDDHLILVDATDTVLTKLSIQSIRVWGVGRDNEHDFAYVAREKSAARQYLCHVFRCEVPARAIANALRDACRRLMAERQKMQSLKQQQLVEKAAAAAAAASSSEVAIIQSESDQSNHLRTPATRPGSLPMSYQNGPSSLSSGAADPEGAEDDDEAFASNQVQQPLSLTSFPTPMEEPRKSMKAEYLGSVQVPKPMGMEVLTPAIEKLSTRVPRDRWQKVDVVVAPSTVQVPFCVCAFSPFCWTVCLLYRSFVTFILVDLPGKTWF